MPAEILFRLAVLKAQGQRVHSPSGLSLPRAKEIRDSPFLPESSIGFPFAVRRSAGL